MNALKNKWLWFGAGLAVGVPVFAFGWWLVSPLFFDTEVDEAFPLTENAVIPAGITQADAETVMMTMSKVEVMMDETMPKEMTEATSIALKTGQFADADSFHKGEGTATIYRLSDGSHVLRIEDFKVTNGPDLHVLLSKGPGTGLDVSIEDLGKLKGNVGNQNYAIPDNIDVSQFTSVIIYCQPFKVEFSVAKLN
jgi:hypothetical protein